MKDQRIVDALVALLNENRPLISSIEEESIRKEIFKELCDQIFSAYDEALIKSIKMMTTYMSDLHPVEEIIDNLNQRVENDALLQSQNREAAEGFDARYGTCTTQILEQFELNEAIDMDRLIHATCYYPSPIEAVRAGIKRLKSHQIDYSEYTFIDIGSGMGRNLLIASDFPFQKIMGVEISSYLTEIAEANVAKYQSDSQLCHNFELLCTDALQFKPPEGKLVFYFWEPFSELISTPFVEQLNAFAEQSSHEITLIFLEAVFPAIQATETFSRIDAFDTGVLISEGRGNYKISIFSSAKIMAL